MNFIQKTLRIGTIYTTDRKANFSVSSQRELMVLVSIFSKYNLNTSKHLDFLVFSQAFTSYLQDSTPEARKKLKPYLDELIVSCNSKRTDFQMPIDHEFNITTY